MAKGISVVIPAKDEEEAIVATIQQVESALKDRVHEIIVVDDGSSDSTAERASGTKARVIKHPHNLGYGAALKSGIKQASHDTIVIIDSDGTYPADQIPVLLGEYEKGFDMIVGARTGRFYFESILKAPLRVFLKFLVGYTTGRKVPDVNSGLRVFSKERVVNYFSHLSNAFSFTTTLTLVYSMNGLFISYVNIPYHKRAGKTKVHLFRDSLRTLQFITEAITKFNPLKIFLLLSGVVLIGSLLAIFVNIFLGTNLLYFIGAGGIMLSIHIFCLGLLAVILKSSLENRK